jgi:hypothetical protein
MDLSGHGAFLAATSDRDLTNRPGARLLTAAWVALASRRAESVTIHLRHGLQVDGVLGLRVDGALAEAATRPGQWTHVFLVEDVVLVRQVSRGGDR